MSSGRVKLDITGGVAAVTLDRPDKLNAVTPAMAADLARMCRELDSDAAVRVVLLTGTGSKGFCTGTDLNGLAGFATAWDYRNRVEYAAAVRAMRKPVVAALFGWVLGGGAELALSADLRIADETAVFGFPEVVNGWVPGGGGTQLLPRLVGYGQAMRMLLTGDHVTASEALRFGLVEEVTAAGAARARAEEVCARLASLKPLAVEATKAAVRAALSQPLESGVAYENELSSLCFTGQHLEGIDAFRRRRDRQS
ncbi:MAG: enoyl-CoA hydratase/isomerase family protein [Aestuariivirga sp.]